MSTQRFFDDYRYAISWALAGVLLVSVFASIFLIAQTIVVLDKNDDSVIENSITISGKGEIIAIPDVATFSFTISETAETVESAQSTATEKNNTALKYLKNEGVDEKDIKTTSYNVYPKYEWIRPQCAFDGPCPGGNNELVGYTVSQTTKVKVRDTQKAGDILSGIGQIGISNVSGLTFSIDDEEGLKEEARAMAIKDAKEKAEKIADDLGVDLDDVISFSEDSGFRGGIDYGFDAVMTLEAKSSSAPEISVGENTITSRVYVTFEID
jgi:uncharacterized protein YggE